MVFAEKYPSMLDGLALVHSQVFADDEAAKENRDRTIGLVMQDKFSFLSVFIPSLFAPDLREKLDPEIRHMIGEARKMKPEGIIAAILGMKARHDTSAVLKSLDIPVLFIFGLLDNRIPLPRALEMISLARHPDALILQDIAHMGFYEAPEVTLAAIRQFAASL